MSEILRLENINYSYIDGGYERQILKDLSYTFEAGKFYTIFKELAPLLLKLLQET